MKDISLIVADVNTLVPFQLTVDNIVEWSTIIDRLNPGMDLESLRFLIDKFAMDEIEWDKSKGIQNIFNGLRRVYFTNKYELSKQC